MPVERTAPVTGSESELESTPVMDSPSGYEADSGGGGGVGVGGAIDADTHALSHHQQHQSHQSHDHQQPYDSVDDDDGFDEDDDDDLDDDLEDDDEYSDECEEDDEDDDYDDDELDERHALASVPHGASSDGRISDGDRNDSTSSNHASWRSESAKTGFVEALIRLLEDSAQTQTHAVRPNPHANQQPQQTSEGVAAAAVAAEADNERKTDGRLISSNNNKDDPNNDSFGTSVMEVAAPFFSQSSLDAAFLLSCEGGHIRILYLLLPRISSISLCNERGETGLHLAARAGHGEIVDLLVKQGLDVESRDCDGLTPLHAAVLNQKVYVCGQLIRSTQPRASVHTRDLEGNTVLHSAARLGLTQVILLLMPAGADPNARNANDDTPIDVAKSAEVSRVILECSQLQQQRKKNQMLEAQIAQAQAQKQQGQNQTQNQTQPSPVVATPATPTTTPASTTHHASQATHDSTSPTHSTSAPSHSSSSAARLHRSRKLAAARRGGKLPPAPIRPAARRSTPQSQSHSQPHATHPSDTHKKKSAATHDRSKAAAPTSADDDDADVDDGQRVENVDESGYHQEGGDSDDDDDELGDDGEDEEDFLLPDTEAEEEEEDAQRRDETEGASPPASATSTDKTTTTSQPHSSDQSTSPVSSSAALADATSMSSHSQPQSSTSSHRPSSPSHPAAQPSFQTPQQPHPSFTSSSTTPSAVQPPPTDDTNNQQLVPHHPSSAQQSPQQSSNLTPYDETDPMTFFNTPTATTPSPSSTVSGSASQATICQSPFRQLPPGPASHLFWTAIGVGADSLMFQPLHVYPFDRLQDTERILVLAQVAEAMTGLSTQELQPNVLNESALYAVFALMKIRIQKEIHPPPPDQQQQQQHQDPSDPNVSPPTPSQPSTLWRGRVLEAYEQVYQLSADACGLRRSCTKLSVWTAVINLLARSLFGEAFREKKKIFFAANGWERKLRQIAQAREEAHAAATAAAVQHGSSSADSLLPASSSLLRFPPSYFTVSLPSTHSLEIQLTFKKLILMSRTFLAEPAQAQTQQNSNGPTANTNNNNGAVVPAKGGSNNNSTSGTGTGNNNSVGGCFCRDCIAELDVPYAFKMQFLEDEREREREREREQDKRLGHHDHGKKKKGKHQKDTKNKPDQQQLLAASNAPNSAQPASSSNRDSSPPPYTLDSLILTGGPELQQYWLSLSMEEKWALTELPISQLQTLITQHPCWELLRAALESYTEYAWEEDVLEIHDGATITLADEMCEESGMGDMLAAMAHAIHMRQLEERGDLDAACEATLRSIAPYTHPANGDDGSGTMIQDPIQALTLNPSASTHSSRQMLENLVLSEFGRKIAWAFLQRTRESRAQQMALELEMELIEEEEREAAKAAAQKAGGGANKAAKKKKKKKKAKTADEDALHASEQAAAEAEAAAKAAAEREAAEARRREEEAAAAAAAQAEKERKKQEAKELKAKLKKERKLARRQEKLEQQKQEEQKQEEEAQQEQEQEQPVEKQPEESKTETAVATDSATSTSILSSTPIVPPAIDPAAVLAKAAAEGHAPLNNKARRALLRQAREQAAAEAREREQARRKALGLPPLEEEEEAEAKRKAEAEAEEARKAEEDAQAAREAEEQAKKAQADAEAAAVAVATARGRKNSKSSHVGEQEEKQHPSSSAKPRKSEGKNKQPNGAASATHSQPSSPARHAANTATRHGEEKEKETTKEEKEKDVNHAVASAPPVSHLSLDELTGGVMLMCSRDRDRDRDRDRGSDKDKSSSAPVCLRVLGLPKKHGSILQALQAPTTGHSLAIFLFNVTDRLLHGVYVIAHPTQTTTMVDGKNDSTNKDAKQNGGNKATNKSFARSQVAVGGFIVTASLTPAAGTIPFPPSLPLLRLVTSGLDQLDPIPEAAFRHLFADGNRMRQMETKQVRELIAIFRSRARHHMTHSAAGAIPPPLTVDDPSMPTNLGSNSLRALTGITPLSTNPDGSPNPVLSRRDERRMQRQQAQVAGSNATKRNQTGSNRRGNGNAKQQQQQQQYTILQRSNLLVPFPPSVGTPVSEVTDAAPPIAGNGSFMSGDGSSATSMTDQRAPLSQGIPSHWQRIGSGLLPSQNSSSSMSSVSPAPLLDESGAPNNSAVPPVSVLGSNGAIGLDETDIDALPPVLPSPTASSSDMDVGVGVDVDADVGTGSMGLTASTNGYSDVASSSPLSAFAYNPSLDGLFTSRNTASTAASISGSGSGSVAETASSTLLLDECNLDAASERMLAELENSWNEREPTTGGALEDARRQATLRSSEGRGGLFFTSPTDPLSSSQRLSPRKNLSSLVGSGVDRVSPRRSTFLPLPMLSGGSESSPVAAQNASVSPSLFSFSSGLKQQLIDDAEEAHTNRTTSNIAGSSSTLSSMTNGLSMSMGMGMGMGMRGMSMGVGVNAAAQASLGLHPQPPPLSMSQPHVSPPQRSSVEMSSSPDEVDADSHYVYPSRGSGMSSVGLPARQVPDPRTLKRGTGQESNVNVFGGSSRLGRMMNDQSRPSSGRTTPNLNEPLLSHSSAAFGPLLHAQPTQSHHPHTHTLPPHARPPTHPIHPHAYGSGGSVSGGIDGLERMHAPLQPSTSNAPGPGPGLAPHSFRRSSGSDGSNGHSNLFGQDGLNGMSGEYGMNRPVPSAQQQPLLARAQLSHHPPTHTQLSHAHPHQHQHQPPIHPHPHPHHPSLPHSHTQLHPSMHAPMQASHNTSIQQELYGSNVENVQSLWPPPPSSSSSVTPPSGGVYSQRSSSTSSPSPSPMPMLLHQQQQQHHPPSASQGQYSSASAPSASSSSSTLFSVGGSVSSIWPAAAGGVGPGPGPASTHPTAPRSMLPSPSQQHHPQQHLHHPFAPIHATPGPNDIKQQQQQGMGWQQQPTQVQQPLRMHPFNSTPSGW